ncbi:MAG: replicative DNA helicase [Lentisphaerae bacterium]|nr:replicative DNA helicase [Lentisphaerota bacterium]
MPAETVSAAPRLAGAERVPPHSEEAEQGILGSILLDAGRVMDVSVMRQITPECFYIPAHRIIYEQMLAVYGQGGAVDVLTMTERLRTAGKLEAVGGAICLERLIDATPTPAHAEYYADIVRQKYLLREIIGRARDAEQMCFTSQDDADEVLARVEQDFLDITEHQHGSVRAWPSAVRETMAHVERILTSHRGLAGISTGLLNLDAMLMGLKNGEMVVLAARPSMGKTSLAMNIAENVALGVNDPERTRRAVGIFSLEMSYEALVMRMLCSHAGVSWFQLAQGRVPHKEHGKLAQAADTLGKAPLFLDDTGALDVLELRARARRMKKQHGIELLIIDYLQMLHSREYSRQGRQIETANISNNLKAMAKELKVPVLVVSQLSRAPEQRDNKPKLSDLRDSGAIEQDADVVCLLRRPAFYDSEEEDKTLAIVDVAKQRNGPTGEVKLNFEQDFTRFRDRGVDRAEEFGSFAGPPPEAQGEAEEE